ncbi:unnamed protein product [Strongylus vulgaris]|uniref:Uncharacterized protein n=1 Tax=Strongylus vulgaris TaxID=40348 RepID=A0A3P7JPW9_STRVU|nr:unnamed protein product [Strongylus vulgaris]
MFFVNINIKKFQLSEEFGASHVPFRSFGFKPDFFACTADAVTTECTFLDQATHTPSETAGSWYVILEWNSRNVVFELRGNADFEK